MVFHRSLVFFGAWLFVALPLGAQFQLDIEQVADQAFPKVIDDEEPAADANVNGARHGFDIERNIDAWVFNRFGTQQGAKTHLDKQLKMTIDGIARECKLTDVQKEKLRLAGLGDMTMFFAEVEAIREEFRGENDQNKINQVWQRVQPLQQRMQTNMFGRGSILQKASAFTLNEDQLAKHRQVELERQRFAYRAAVKLLLTTIEKSAPMKSTQRQEMVELLANTPPPRLMGNYINYYVMYQLAKKQQQLNQILEKPQRDAMQQFIQQGKGMEQFLRQHGYIK